MSEMVERVARAMASKMFLDWLYDEQCCALCDPEKLRAKRQMLEDAARAALEVIRELDEVMVQRAYEAVEFNDCWQIEDGHDFLKAYQAVIDTALGEP
jgi:hypothetical protein